jgi:hypothetical protein
VGDGVRNLAYPKNLLPKTDEQMACLLVLPINIKMDESVFTKAETLVSEVNKHW